MKIAVLQASSQKDKNPILEKYVRSVAEQQGHSVINFGVFPGETCNVSYVETALCISFLLESGAVDFVVTGCSSGQGMMLACNSLPGVLCGYVQNPSDAYLLGRINAGNAISYPLGLQFGWAAEINLQSTLAALFDGPFGAGYPKGEAGRKKADTILLKEINAGAKRSLVEILPKLPPEFVKSVFGRECIFDYIKKNGTNREIIELIEMSQP